MLDTKQFSKKTTNVCSNTPMIFNIIPASCFKAVVLHYLSPVRILKCACCSASVAINKLWVFLARKVLPQPATTCSKLTTETLEKVVKYV